MNLGHCVLCGEIGEKLLPIFELFRFLCLSVTKGVHFGDDAHCCDSNDDNLSGDDSGCMSISPKVDDRKNADRNDRHQE